MDGHELSNEQRRAVDAIMEGLNVFVTGDAGTGKSAVIREAASRLEKQGRSYLLTGTTGTAADRLGGITLHKALGLGTMLVQEGELVECSTETLESIEVLFIDEVAVASGPIIDILAEGVGKCEEKGHHVQVVAAGDFHQIGPFIKKQDLPAYKKLPGFHISRIFAFQSAGWHALQFHVEKLVTPFRQTDQEYIRILSLIGSGKTRGLTLLENLGTSPEPIEQAPWITGTRRDMERINAEKIRAFPGREYRINASVIGTFPEEERPVPEQLCLKIGIPVVIIVNDPGRRYVNGSMGKIISIKDERVKVLLSSGGTVSLKRHSWRWQEEDGAEYSQIPLLPAFAMTIHRVQGMTLEAANLKPQTWAHGQLYTALSRVRDPKKLYIDGPISHKWLVCDEAVEKWYQNETYGVRDQKASKRKTKKVEEASIVFVPAGRRREGMRFCCRTYKFAYKNQSISRTFVCLANETGRTVGVTDYSRRLLPSDKRDSKELTSDSAARCSYIVQLLNFAFIDAGAINSLEELTIEKVRTFLQLYAVGQYGDRKRKQETVEKCIASVTDFLECLTEDKSLDLLFTKKDLYQEAVRRPHKGRGIKTAGLTHTVNALSRDLFYDCEDGIINRNLSEAALRILLSRIWKNHPDILMNACLELTAGLRPAETCAITWEMVEILWSRNEAVSVKINLEKEVRIRTDGVSTGMIKKPRIAKVQTPFLGIFKQCYERYTEWKGVRHPEGQPIAIGVNCEGNPISYKSYYNRFKKVADEIIPLLRADQDLFLQMEGDKIADEGLAPHVLRHVYTIFLVLCGYSSAELMDARGDTSTASAEWYLANKGDLQNYYDKTIDCICSCFQELASLRRA